MPKLRYEGVKWAVPMSKPSGSWIKRLDVQVQADDVCKGGGAWDRTTIKIRGNGGARASTRAGDWPA